jgi:hypothetical protein
MRSASSQALSGTGLSGTASGSRAGINVFGDVEERVDPSAQTAITGGIREQINLEGVGSGSGLLDLTRESDDTSLGAVLDGIGPAIGGRSHMDTIDPSGMMEDDDEPVAPRAVAAPIYVTKPDPLAPAFGGAALAATGCLLFAIYVLLSEIAGVWPEEIKSFNSTNWYMPLVYGFGAVILFVLIGLVLGKTMSAAKA